MSDWVRSTYTFVRDPRAVSAVDMPTIHLSAAAAAGTVRLVLSCDGVKMATLAIPGIPANTEVVLDGRTRRVTGVYEGTTRSLPLSFVDGSLDDLAELNTSRGEWQLAVDQPPETAVPIDVRLVVTPIGSR